MTSTTTNNPSPKLPITVIILAKKDDSGLDRAQKSVMFAAEVLVITKPAPITDFSMVRNEAISQASQPWVLFLDSDEAVAPESVAEISRLIKQDHCAGIEVLRRDIFHQRPLYYGEAGMMTLLRLGKRDQLHFSRPVHEVATVSGEVCTSNILIYHHAHPDINQFFDKNRYYAQLAAQDLAQRGQSFSLLKLIFYPPLKFSWNFFFKLGFLDGWRGFVYALMMSLHSCWVRVFQYELKLTNQSAPDNPSNENNTD